MPFFKNSEKPFCGADGIVFTTSMRSETPAMRTEQCKKSRRFYPMLVTNRTNTHERSIA